MNNKENVKTKNLKQIKNIKKENEIEKTNNKVLKILKDYYAFYKENIKKTHIIMYIISLIILFITLNFLISSIDTNETVKQFVESGGKNSIQQSENVIKTIFTEKIPVVFLILLAGITPYFFIPILGMLVVYDLAGEIATMYTMAYGISNLMIMSFGVIVQVLGISLAITMGMFFCKISTKRFKYIQFRGFSFDDLKRGIYEIKKDEEKLKKLENKVKLKQEALEKCNVKVPYKNLVVTFCISTILVVIGTLISSI